MHKNNLNVRFELLSFIIIVMITFPLSLPITNLIVNDVNVHFASWLSIFIDCKQKIPSSVYLLERKVRAGYYLFIHFEWYKPLIRWFHLKAQHIFKICIAWNTTTAISRLGSQSYKEIGWHQRSCLSTYSLKILHISMYFWQICHHVWKDNMKYTWEQQIQGFRPE